MAFNHSIIQSFKQSFNQAIIQSSNQATKQRYHTFIAFTKTYLKIPYFFIIPPFINPFIPSFILPCINPHCIFKPFDSISPIFKPVGPTELNSKEK